LTIGTASSVPAILQRIVLENPPDDLDAGDLVAMHRGRKKQHRPWLHAIEHPHRHGHRHRFDTC
jgi:hypothetical protein